MKICIAGDSWGCGEWDPELPKVRDCMVVAHQGLEEYLKSSHQVINVSRGGGSNSESIKHLSTLVNVRKHKFDYVFWFKTDPLRDLRPYDFFKQPRLSFEEILNEQRRLTQKSYEALNHLGITVHCIGGAGKLDVELMKDFSNLVPYIPCLTEMIEPSYVHPIIWASDWITDIFRQMSIQCLDQLVACKKQQDNLAEYKKYFWPDGSHPNREGHRLLYNKICRDFAL